MAGTAEMFREVHRLHRTVRDLREQLNRLPLQHKAQAAKVARQEELLREGQEALKRLKVRTLELEGALKAKHQQMKKYEEQQRGATSAKEYEAFKTEIGHARDECSRLEDQILAAMAEAEERAAALPGVEKALAQARQDAERLEETSKERQATLGAALAEAQRQLREAETQVPADVRTHYERMVQAMGADALAPVRDRACGACSTELTAQDNNDLRVGAYLACKACGRILYLPA